MERFIIVYSGYISIEHPHLNYETSEEPTGSEHSNKKFYIREYPNPNKEHGDDYADLRFWSESYVKIYIQINFTLQPEHLIKFSDKSIRFQVKKIFFNNREINFHVNHVIIVYDEKVISETLCDNVYENYIGNEFECKLPQSFYYLKIFVRYRLNLVSFASYTAIFLILTVYIW